MAAQPEILESKDFCPVLKDAIKYQQAVVMSYLAGGKWHLCDTVFTTVTEGTIHIRVISRNKARPITIQINQPVGVSLQQGYNKFIFETVVIGVEAGLSQEGQGHLILEMPDWVEKMQRRAYARVPIPKNLNVKALFWHRGYTDDCAEVPLENYWQGRMIDLSAGGAQISIEMEHGLNFRTGQLVGLQFTPMSYQRPLILEGHIRRIVEKAEDRRLYIGLEFLGLEASSHGRERLRSIVSVVDEYQKLNTTCEQAGIADDHSA